MVCQKAFKLNFRNRNDPRHFLSIVCVPTSPIDAMPMGPSCTCSSCVDWQGPKPCRHPIDTLAGRCPLPELPIRPERRTPKDCQDPLSRQVPQYFPSRLSKKTIQQRSTWVRNDPRCVNTYAYNSTSKCTFRCHRI